MKMKLLPIKCAIIIALFILVIPISEENTHVFAFSNQVIQHGAVGDDVLELQSRLQYIGYYNGKIDGVYDWKTYWAVRNFQYEFGIPIDGLVGEVTKVKLLKTTKYYKGFVNNQIRKGNKFTHYGGVDLNKQSKPVPKKSNPKTAKPNAQGQTAQPKLAQQNGQGQTAQPKTAPPNGQGQSAQPKAAPPNGQGKSAQPKTAPPNGQGQSAQPKAAPPNGQGQTAQPKTAQRNAQGQTAQPKTAQRNAQGQTAQPKTAQPKPKVAAQPKKPSAVNTPNGFAQNDINLMANAVYGEARGEPFTGQVAVAAVIINRVNSVQFPNTVSGVIFEPGAFTAVADGQIYLTPNEQAKKAVLDAINGLDPTGEAIYYFNPDTATNKWIWSRPQIKRIGKHIFCK